MTDSICVICGSVFTLMPVNCSLILINGSFADINAKIFV